MTNEAGRIDAVELSAGTAQFLADVVAELQRARGKFPGNRVMLAALHEESGELAKALLDLSYAKGFTIDVYREAVQVACMAVRVATEGDDSFPAYDPAAAMKQARNLGER